MSATKRILVVTVSSWNSVCGANTWASLLEHYDSENIANICIRNEIPDSRVCSRYFSISENRILRSIFCRRTVTAQEITEQRKDRYNWAGDLARHNARYKKLGKKRSYLLLLAREIVWMLGKWKSRELDAFIDDFKPDVVLHSMEGYIHLNRITEYIIRRTGAKAIGYIWDDNFTYKQSKRFGYKVYRYFQRRSLRRLAGITDAFFAISDMTKREADAFFEINCQVLTKPLNKIPVVVYKEIRKPIRMLYTGNLYIGRDNSLLRVLKAIRTLPKGTFFVDVYTNTQLDDAYLASIDPEICCIHEPIPQKLVLEKQKQADILLFLEATEGEDMHMARLSFSTKITDYLSSGRCILAVGNLETAPMQYFLENKAALVACEQDQIMQVLKTIAEQPDLLVRYAEAGAELGKKNHNKEKIQKLFNVAIESL